MRDDTTYYETGVKKKKDASFVTFYFGGRWEKSPLYLRTGSVYFVFCYLGKVCIRHYLFLPSLLLFIPRRCMYTLMVGEGGIYDWIV